MTRQEISQASTTELQLRLVVVDYSTIARQAAEALLIRSELTARRAARAA
jgi:hypothetical protein